MIEAPENIYHKCIKIPVDFFPFYSKKETDLLRDGMYEVDLKPSEFEIHNSEFVNWLQSLNVKIYKARYIESIPNVQYVLHTDDYRPHIKNVIKLNLIFSSHGTKMLWYKLKPDHLAVPATNNLGHYMHYYPLDNVTEVYRHQADSHCLLDTRHIHTVHNTDNNGVNRICYSLFLRYASNTDKRLDWWDTLEIFKPFIED